MNSRASLNLPTWIRATTLQWAACASVGLAVRTIGNAKTIIIYSRANKSTGVEVLLLTFVGDFQRFLVLSVLTELIQFAVKRPNGRLLVACLRHCFHNRKCKKEGIILCNIFTQFSLEHTRSHHKGFLFFVALIMWHIRVT